MPRAKAPAGPWVVRRKSDGWYRMPPQGSHPAYVRTRGTTWTPDLAHAKVYRLSPGQAIQLSALEVIYGDDRIAAASGEEVKEARGLFEAVQVDVVIRPSEPTFRIKHSYGWHLHRGVPTLEAAIEAAQNSIDSGFTAWAAVEVQGESREVWRGWAAGAGPEGP